VLRTPVHHWRGREIVDRVGTATQILLKMELFQHTGTFKVRGTISNVAALDSAERRRSLTAVSAGNHAIAAAYAAAMFSTSAKVVMIQTADSVRIEAARAYGAEILMAASGAEAFAMAERIRDDEGRAFVHPFEGLNVALGTGTLGLEMHEQMGALNAVIVSVGGGGLISGIFFALRQLQPGIEIIGVEPSGADTMHRSFSAGSPQSLDAVSAIADSLAPPYALPYSFALCRQNVDRLVMIDDAQIIDAMRLLNAGLKFAVEPSCAAALAALIGPLREELEGKRWQSCSADRTLVRAGLLSSWPHRRVSPARCRLKSSAPLIGVAPTTPDCACMSPQ
jgi:threonine dehydratase